MTTVNVIVIRNDDDLEAAVERVAELWGSAVGTPEGDELHALSILIEAYENAHHPVPLPTPIEAIRFVMDQRKLRNRELEPFIGPASRVSEVLSGKTKLTVKMIRKLHDGLGIPLESLVAEGAYDRPKPLAKVRLVNPVAKIRPRKLG